MVGGRVLWRGRRIEHILIIFFLDPNSVWRGAVGVWRAIIARVCVRPLPACGAGDVVVAGRAGQRACWGLTLVHGLVAGVDGRQGVVGSGDGAQGVIAERLGEGRQRLGWMRRHGG